MARVVGHSAGYPVKEIWAKFGPPGIGRFVFGSKLAMVAGFDP